ncbi:hypothetical protein NYQ43_00020 [Xanthomonas translucens pv. translucens]|jgi:hypothetical protein|uniref:hypothetical protein n=1 Tax=Xanthomonas campestris pv. translucens TaxID=343 RepID=UPI001F6039FC|nr:hypothetical protein [Xanthomonas translucens]MCT8284114.1 hypothetical protein [Xanthomonas translucens pv. translucens]MCT8301772.1 hypothetical protein [Xanthomonas translucens pv. translucens]UNT98451.1 hypothetical protein KBQ49_15790 [Xanthomonas translucens pv. translucens]
MIDEQGARVTKIKTKAPARASRTLLAKVIGFKLRRRMNWSTPRVDDVLREVLSKTPTISGRHVPDPTGGISGQRCAFINRATDYGTGGVMFEVCTYLQGHIPESLIPDLTQREADISVVEIKDADGNKGEIVHSFRCLVLGQVMIMERARGVPGAASIVQTLLTQLFRRHTTDKTHPALVLVDIVAADLRAMIRAKGGVHRITARLAVDAPAVESRYGGLLSGVRTKVAAASACAVTWEAAGTLDENQAVEILEEAEDETLSAVTLHFKHGGSISDLSTYRERLDISVQLLSDGRVAVTEIEAEMRDYLHRLCTGEAIDSIQEDGTVTRIKTIGKKRT